MSTMNISVPDTMKIWVHSQIEKGVYANASDYIRDLIRQDQMRQERLLAFQAAITKGLASGISDKSMDDVLREARELAKDL
jgi:antitoxin ParD1/3/4